MTAAESVGARAGVDLAAYVVGPGRAVRDVHDDWARLRGVEESGCVLVRPDGYVAWRRAAVADDCAAELAAALARVLGLSRSPEEPPPGPRELAEA